MRPQEAERDPAELYDVEAEQLLIGTVLSDERAFWTASTRVAAEDFYDAVHQRLWTEITARKDRNELVSPLTLRRFAETDAGLTEIGGASYLANLARSAPMAPMVGEYARIIRGHAQRRAIIQIAEDLINETWGTVDDPASLSDRAGEALYEAAHRDEPGEGPQDIEMLVSRAAQAAEDAKNAPHKTFISTGLDPIDKALGGLFPRKLVVLGAASSVGKTGLATQIAESAARAGHQTLLFSKEMDGAEISTRYIAQNARVTAERIETGRISDAEMDRIAKSPQAYRGVRLAIDDASNLSVAQIRARAQALKRRKGTLSLIVIDHLGYIRPADTRADETKQLQQIVVDLKRLANELGVAILLISHLNRELWKRASKRPLISDLHGSSAIEKTADQVWFLHREEYYLEREQPDASDEKAFTLWAQKLEKAKGWAEVFAAKRRGGPLGSARLKFEAPFVRFIDPDAEAPTTGPSLFTDLTGSPR